MLVPRPIVYRKRRGKVRPPAVSPTPPVIGPVLVAASRVGYELTLVFDRAVSIPAELAGDVIAVFDGVEGVEYRNTVSVTLVGPETVVVSVLEAAPFEGAGVTLVASGATGIVAASDDAPWAGVAGVALPFP